MTIKQTAGRDQLGDFAPKFAQLNDDVLFGEVWSRTKSLSLRDRSLVTVTALMAQGITDESIRYHLVSAKANGITREEIAEIVTHAAFYCGWPKAWAVFRIAKEVWAEDEPSDAMAAHANEMIFPIGAENEAFGKYFTGKSRLALLANEPAGVFNITFEPSTRSIWHVHKAAEHGGHILVCVAGRGFYQEWGQKPVEMNPGDIIYTRSEVKHWHGAAPDSWFSHLAIELPGKDTGIEWLEEVSDEEYEAAVK